MKKIRQGIWSVVLLLLAFCGVGFSPCARRDAAMATPAEINLYSGVENIARLGDTEEQVLARSQYTPAISNIPPGSDLDTAGLSELIEFSEIGTKVYLKYGRVALIEIQEPFIGSIHGKKFALFSFSLPTGENWEQTLLKEFGDPISRGTGGRLGSQTLFYPWGDLAFNGMGTNQLAIYRDQSILRYRQKNFGRVVNFFKND